MVDCEKFIASPPKAKRQKIIDAKRCLNCLSLDHFARACPFPSKCHKCGLNCQNKHAGSLHDCYSGEKLGTATFAEVNPASTRGNEGNENEQNSKTVCKVNSIENWVILMRTSAVKVFNPVNGILTQAYVQHYTALQAMLISDSLKHEPGLITAPDTSLTLSTLADQIREGQTNFKLESLYSGEQFMINDALIVPRFSHDVSTLPHAVNTSTLGHFDGVHIPVAPRCKRINVLIGQPDKALLRADCPQWRPG